MKKLHTSCTRFRSIPATDAGLTSTRFTSLLGLCAALFAAPPGVAQAQPEAAPSDSAAADTAAEEAAPAEPAPAEPAPVEPAPVEPGPVEPAPVEPAPVDTIAEEAATEPAPADTIAEEAATEPAAAAPEAEAAAETPAEAEPPAEAPAESAGTSGSVDQDDMFAALKGAEFALALGYGGLFSDTLGNTNPLGMGIGLTGGAEFGQDSPVANIYIGGRALYYAGDSEELPTGTFGMNSWLLAVDVAYGIDVYEGVRVRPGLAGGIMLQRQDGPVPFAGYGVGAIAGSGKSDHYVTYLAPGASARWLVPDVPYLFVGADARFSLQLGDSDRPGAEFFALVGAKI